MKHWRFLSVLALFIANYAALFFLPEWLGFFFVKWLLKPTRMTAYVLLHLIGVETIPDYPGPTIAVSGMPPVYLWDGALGLLGYALFFALFLLVLLNRHRSLRWWTWLGLFCLGLGFTFLLNAVRIVTVLMVNKLWQSSNSPWVEAVASFSIGPVYTLGFFAFFSPLIWKMRTQARF